MTMPPPLPAISDDDWSRTPLSVQHWIVDIIRRVAQLEAEVSARQEQNRWLQERLSQNSHHSSPPPSADGPTAPPRAPQTPSGKRRGGQPGHTGHARVLVAVEPCRRVEDHRPAPCRPCGGRLSGDDPEAYRHPVVEIPPIPPYVEEHRRHELTCAACGTSTRAPWPEGVTASGYAPRVVAITARLSRAYRRSARRVEGLMPQVLGVGVSVGTVSHQREAARRAVALPVQEAPPYVPPQKVVPAEETGFAQGHAEGGKAQGRKAWLWVAVTEWVAVFLVRLSRGQDTARELLGAAFAGYLIADRWNGYNWVRLLWRQLGWAPLKREFMKIAEREGESGRIGRALLQQEAVLLAYWHRVRDGTLAWSTFQNDADAVRQRIQAWLTEGAEYGPAKGEKSARAQTARTCRGLLKMEPARWLFIRVQGIEPTNNAAERTIRHAVLWRRTSFGSQSEAGSEFVARMLTVIMTRRLPKRHVLEYLTQACQAARKGQAAPSLLPNTP